MSSPTGAPGSSSQFTYRGTLFGVGLLSGLINILYLTGSFFMLQVYDRVIPSRSVPTLVGLAGLALVLYLFQGAFDAVRGRILVRLGAALEETMGPRVFDAMMRLPLRLPGREDGLQPLRDIETVKSFLCGAGPMALFDLPWMPLYVAICYVFHPLIGVTAMVGAEVLVLLALLAEVLSRQRTRQAAQITGQRMALVQAGQRHAEALAAMGMASRFAARWRAVSREHVAAQGGVSDVAGSLAALSKAFRMILQSAVLGVGAWLVIRQEATGGIMIASSILMSRALAPVELAISQWRPFLAARQARRRLLDLLRLLEPVPRQLALPAPVASVAVEALCVAVPNSQRLIVQNVDFTLSAGQGLGIIGPSASGKSSLVRAMVGAWVPARGAVRFDGAALDQWSPDALGRHLGYLPQVVGLFAGSIAQNVARMQQNPPANAVIAAARAAGVHEMILRLEHGYETQLGEDGAGLSAGQRQRIALARALYGDPFLVVLDEPNSNLDQDGETALTKAILGIRERGGIAVVVAHRASALLGVDKVLVLADGRMQAFGNKDEILARVLARPAVAASGLNVVASDGKIKA